MIHGLVDFFGEFDKIYVLLQADLAAYEASLAQVPSILFSNIPEEAVGTISLLIYLGTLAIALLACGTAVYLLRPGEEKPDQ